MVLVWSHWCGAGIDNIAVPRWEFTRSPFMWREVMGDSTCNWSWLSTFQISERPRSSWLSLTYGSIFHYVELSKTCSRRAFTFTQKRQDVQSGKIIWSCTPEMLHYRVALKLFTLVALGLLRKSADQLGSPRRGQPTSVIYYLSNKHMISSTMPKTAV